MTPLHEWIHPGSPILLPLYTPQETPDLSSQTQRDFLWILVSVFHGGQLHTTSQLIGNKTSPMHRWKPNIYAQAVEDKLFPSLRSIGSHQASTNERNSSAINQLLKYVATYPNYGITYCNRSMVLAGNSDASLLNESNTRSLAGAHIFLSEEVPIPFKKAHY